MLLLNKGACVGENPSMGRSKLMHQKFKFGLNPNIYVYNQIKIKICIYLNLKNFKFKVN